MNQTFKDFRTNVILLDEVNLWKRHFLKLIKDEFFSCQKVFELDEYNKNKIRNCWDWVIGNVDIYLNKGLLLYGDIGTGKSCLLKATKKLCNILYPEIFTIYITANDIALLFKENNENSETKLRQIMTCKILFIDDIGYEPLKIFEYHPIQSVILERYDKKRITCLTSNLNNDEIYSRYGASFEDKLNQMTFKLKFEGKSKR